MSEPVIIIINPPPQGQTFRTTLDNKTVAQDNTAFDRAIAAINAAREEGGHVQLFRGH